MASPPLNPPDFTFAIRRYTVKHIYERNSVVAINHCSVPRGSYRYTHDKPFDHALDFEFPQVKEDNITYNVLCVGWLFSGRTRIDTPAVHRQQ